MPSPTHTLWPTLPPELANDILLSVQKGNKKLYRTAVEVMAPRMGIRVPTLLEMPKTQRHATWIQILARPDMEVLSFNILSAWLIEAHRPMLCAWLDALGIEHGTMAARTASRPSRTPPRSRRASISCSSNSIRGLSAFTCARSTRSTKPGGPAWTRFCKTNRASSRRRRLWQAPDSRNHRD